MRHLATSICVGLLLPCFGAAQASWDASITAGKAALESRQYGLAEQRFHEALTAASQFGEKDARFSASLLFLAQASDAQSKQDQAEAFARRAAEAMEKSLKAYKPAKAEDQYQETSVASVFFDRVGDLFAAHHKYPEAETFYRRVIELRSAAAEDNPRPRNNEDFLRFFVQVAENTSAALATAQEKLANLCFTEHKYDEAARIYRQAVAIREGQGQPKPFLARSVSNLATCYAAQGKYDQGEPLYRRALALFEEANWKEKPESLQAMQLYALLLRKTGREEEAKAMLANAAAIARQPGPSAK
jgi:tetratricopeptide (TPR) repeat protein